MTLERKYLPIKLEDKAFEMLGLLEGVLRLRGLFEYSGIIEEEFYGEAKACNAMIDKIDEFVKSVK